MRANDFLELGKHRIRVASNRPQKSPLLQCVEQFLHAPADVIAAGAEHLHDLFLTATGLGRVLQRPVDLVDPAGYCRAVFVGMAAYRDDVVEFIAVGYLLLVLRHPRFNGFRTVLVPAMQAPARTIRNARTLIAAAEEIGVPILLTEQYPEGLGPTVPDIASATRAPVLRKLHFSCMEDEGFAAAFEALGRRQIAELETDLERVDRGDAALEVRVADVAPLQVLDEAVFRLRSGRRRGP